MYTGIPINPMFQGCLLLVSGMLIDVDHVQQCDLKHEIMKAPVSF